MNSETPLQETTPSRNPKLIRSFPSDLILEARLREERAKTGRSISSIIREAVRRFFGLE